MNTVTNKDQNIKDRSSGLIVTVPQMVNRKKHKIGVVNRRPPDRSVF